MIRHMESIGVGLCEECGNPFKVEDLLNYKYEPQIKVCEDCNANMLREDGE